MNAKITNIITWIAQGVMSLIFLMAGGMKLFTPYEDYVEMMPYAADLPAIAIKIIGLLEILGTIGMTLPLLLKKFRFLAPLSAIGLAATMVGAIIVHAGRGESFMMQVVFMTALVFIAIVRFRRLKR